MRRVILFGTVLTTGCLNLPNVGGPDFNLTGQAIPVQFVSVTLSLSQDDRVIAEDTRCVETPTLDTPVTVQFTALSGGLVVPVDFTSRIQGLAIFEAAYDTGRFTLNGVPLNSTAGNASWSRPIAVQNLLGTRLIYSATIDRRVYSIRLSVTELTASCSTGS